MTERRFPPPWSAEVTPNCFIVRDANGQALSYVYYESELGRRSAAPTAKRRRSAADCGEHRQAAGVAAKDRELVVNPRTNRVQNNESGHSRSKNDN